MEPSFKSAESKISHTLDGKHHDLKVGGHKKFGAALAAPNTHNCCPQYPASESEV
jgi:hypothetical protein